MFGEFANWTSPGLFITGALRYLSNDVFFDASSISAAQVMAEARVGDALTLGAASSFDLALDQATDLMAIPRDQLTDTQRQFLGSAAQIQGLQDYQQAIRSFDSLSAHGMADAANALMQQAAMPISSLMDHIGNLHAGSNVGGSWSAQPTAVAWGAGGTGTEQAGGFDQWLSNRLVLGSSFSRSDSNLQFDRSGGNAHDLSAQWDVFLRHQGYGDTYLLGDVGYSHHQLGLQRQIDLGSSISTAYANRNLDVMRAYVEAGREFRLGQARLTPFSAVSYAAMRGGSFTEQGSSGFELVGQSSLQTRSSAAVGLRAGRDWNWGNDRWIQLDLTGGYLRLLNAHDDSLAAFAGTPDATFALDGIPVQQNSNWTQMSFGIGGTRWAGQVSYARQSDDDALSLGLHVAF